MRPVENVHAVAPEYDADDLTGFRSGAVRLGPRLGGAKLGMTVYELPPGEAICPYHYELSDEEWLICLTGTPTVRTAEGERLLGPGEVCCFPAGERGAHAVRNETGATLRVAMVSTRAPLGVAVYPDSRKLGVWLGEEHHMVRLDPQLGYWDGEGGGAAR